MAAYFQIVGGAVSYTHLRFLLDYHFNEQDIHWLRTKGMSEEVCEYLRTYKWKGDMYARPEGTVCYPHVQMVRIECDLVGAILIETYLLQTMNFHSPVSYTHLSGEEITPAAIALMQRYGIEELSVLR